MENNFISDVSLIYASLICYIIGSLPFGLLIFYLSGKGDIRNKGSGNIGATNILRLAGKKMAITTLTFDISKGFIATLTSYSILGPTASYYSAVSGVIGHMFPIWLKFKGGKGVATSLGIIAAFSWPLAIISILIWSLFVLLFKISAIGAIATAILTPIFFLIILKIQFKLELLMWIPGEPSELYILFLISLLIILKHYSNIISLLKIDINKN